MIKFLVKFLIFIAIICGIAYVTANALLDTYSLKAVENVIDNLQVPNLKLSDPSFKNVEMSSYNAVTWSGVSLTAKMVLNDVSGRKLKATVKADEVTIKALSPLEGIFSINIKGLTASAQAPSKGASAAVEDAPETLQSGELTAQLKVNITSLSDVISQIKNLASEMKKFSEEGKTAIPVQFSAEETITLKGKPYKMRIWVEKKGDVYRLLANKNDLKNIADNLLPGAQTTGPADLDIIANNPIRAPQLLRIRSKASTAASNARSRDPNVPEDAYRHVLWSYLLTKEYGADFAKEVTDSHELTMDAEEMNYPSAEAARKQDYNNNEVGRKYATRGYAEASILDRVMTDPEVIRDDAVKSIK